MKKLISLSIALSALLLTFYLTEDEKITEDRRIFKEEGIGNALNLYYLSRAYPSSEIKAGNIEKAYSQYQNDKSNRSSIADPWELIGPENFSGRTLCLAFNPENANTLFAGSASGGLWRSYSTGEGSQAWHQVNFPAGTNSIGSIAIHPTELM